LLKRELNQKEILRENDVSYFYFDKLFNCVNYVYICIFLKDFISYLNAAASTDAPIQSEEISAKCLDIHSCNIDKEPINNDLSLAINAFDENSQKCNGDDIIKSVKASFKSIYDSNSKSVTSTVSPDKMKPSMENSPVLLIEESKAFTDFTQKTKKTPPSRSKASQKQKEEAKVVLTVKERGQIKRTSHLNNPAASNASFNIEICKEKPISLPSIEKKLSTFKQTELTPDKLSKVQELNKKKSNIGSIYDKLELEKQSEINKSSKRSSSNPATPSISSQSILRSSPRKKIKRN